MPGAAKGRSSRKVETTKRRETKRQFLICFFYLSHPVAFFSSLSKVGHFSKYTLLKKAEHKDVNERGGKLTHRGADLIMSSTRRIISAASAADKSICRLTMKDSVIPRAAMSPTSPFVISKRHQQQNNGRRLVAIHNNLSQPAKAMTRNVDKIR